MRIYGHRGSSDPALTCENPLVENTVAAVTASLAAGADGIEVDLGLSQDGVLVACHDPGLRRLTGTAEQVATTSWDRLRAACDRHGVALARAEWLLVAAGGRPVVLELKQPPPGLVRSTAAALVDVLTNLTAAGLPLDVRVSSFSPAMVAAVRAVAPAALGVRTALLGAASDRSPGLLRRAVAAGHDEIHPQVTALLADPVVVERAHRHRMAVVAWTVNRERAVRRLAGLRVDAVITDTPAGARAALAPARLVAV